MVHREVYKGRDQPLEEGLNRPFRRHFQSAIPVARSDAVVER